MQKECLEIIGRQWTELELSRSENEYWKVNLFDVSFEELFEGRNSHNSFQVEQEAESLFIRNTTECLAICIFYTTQSEWKTEFFTAKANFCSEKFSEQQLFSYIIWINSIQPK